METALRFLHTVGIALFLGSIAGHVVAGALAGEVGTASYLQARAFVSAGAMYLTMPGLLLTLVTGIALARVAGGERNLRNLLHAGLPVVILLLGAFVVAPAGQRATEAAVALARGEAGVTAADVLAAKDFEDRVGGLNVLLSLIVIGLASAGRSSSTSSPKRGPAL